MMIPEIRLPIEAVEPSENSAATKIDTPLKMPESLPGSNGQTTMSVKAMIKIRMM